MAPVDTVLIICACACAHVTIFLRKISNAVKGCGNIGMVPTVL